MSATSARAPASAMFRRRSFTMVPPSLDAFRGLAAEPDRGDAEPEQLQLERGRGGDGHLGARLPARLDGDLQVPADVAGRLADGVLGRADRVGRAGARRPDPRARPD